MKKISVIITSSHAVSDIEVESWYNSVLISPNYGYSDCTIFVSTEVMLDRLRLGLLRGEICPFKIVCEVTGYRSEVNQFGKILNYTDFPLDIGLRLTTDILTESARLIKKDKEKINEIR